LAKEKGPYHEISALFGRIFPKKAQIGEFLLDASSNLGYCVKVQEQLLSILWHGGGKKCAVLQKIKDSAFLFHLSAQIACRSVCASRTLPSGS
jgi:hypothetical protein